MPPHRSAFTGLLREAGVLLFFLSLAALATRPLALDLRGRTLAGPDPVIDLFTVHWISGHLVAPSELFGGNIFHPHPRAVLFSDLSLGTAVLLVPFRLLGVNDPVPLYNLGVLLALAFAGWAFALLVRRLTGSLGSGLLAGTLAAFGSHQLSHVYHLNLLSTGWLALLLLALHRLAERPGWGWVALAGASFALCAQSSGYYAVAATLLALVFAAARWRRFRQGRVLRAALAAAALGAVLTAPYLAQFLKLREEERLRRPPGMSRRMAFRPERDLTGFGYVYGTALGSGGERLFPGLLSLALAAVAVARRRPASGFYAGATLLLLAVSLGPEARVLGRVVPLPYRALFGFPPLDGMRHPYTFAAVATFMLAVLAGIGWASLPAARRPWAAALVLALAVIETLAPPPQLRAVPPGLPPVYELATALPPGPILEVPVSAPDALLWAARHGRPVVNGDGAFMPARHALLDRFLRRHWVDRTPEDVDESKPMHILAEFEIRYLIVPSGRRPALRPLAESIGRSRLLRLVAEAEDGDRVYELER